MITLARLTRKWIAEPTRLPITRSIARPTACHRRAGALSLSHDLPHHTLAVIHYHGLPITPASAAAKAISGGHAFVSFRHPEQLTLAAEAAQSFAVDNGAFSAWTAGEAVTDWSGYYAWVDGLARCPPFDFAVIPDVIDGSEAENDALLDEWPFPRWLGAPVWHLHESTSRLAKLVASWPRVCLGSSGRFAAVGTASWWGRMAEAMDAACDAMGRPLARLHGLRMLDPSVFTRLPLSSADSTNIARNIGIEAKWRGPYTPPNKDARASLMRGRIESHQAAVLWDRGANPVQAELVGFT